MGTKTLYIHIGSPKTGTTSIQTTFARNRATLEEMGVLYLPTLPQRQAHHDLAWALRAKFGVKTILANQAGASLEDLFADLLEDINRSPAQSAVVSSEAFFHLGKQHKRALKLLRRRFAAFEVKIIVYLRRQDLFFESNYSQNVKAGSFFSAPPDTHFLRILSEQGLRYDQLLAPWASVFGLENILLRVFERDQLNGGDAVADFGHALGLEAAALASLERGQNYNVTPSAEAVVLLSRLNQIELPRDTRVALYRQILDCPAMRESTTGSKLISTPLRLKAMKQYQRSNERVRKRYRPDLAQLFTRPDELEPGVVYAPEGVTKLADSLPDHILAKLVRASLKTSEPI